MTTRNLSAQTMFEQWAIKHRPKFRFDGTSRSDFGNWKAKALPQVRACLGDFPPRVPLNPELLVEWEHDGLKKQRWVIDVLPNLAATVQINLPGNLKKGQRKPAILCWHGHGNFGKDSVMGNNANGEVKAEIGRHNYDYGHQMAKQGFVTFAADWMGMGERKEDRGPNWHNQSAGRDWCNLFYLQATMLGMTSISINVTIGMAATDLICSQPFVDKNNLGVMGLSGGGTMTLWSAFCDERFGAAEIIGYSNLFWAFGYRDTNYCGMQVAPGLFKLADLPDLQGLLAPRPLLVDIGVYDSCFSVDEALQCYKLVEKIYRAAGASNKLELDLGATEHGWVGKKAPAFFRKHLK